MDLTLLLSRETFNLFLLSATPFLMAQTTTGPKFDIIPFSDGRVTISGLGSAEFWQYLSSTGKLTGVTLANVKIPYSVVLSNKSAQTIIAYSVYWTGSGQDGQLRRSIQVVADTVNLSGILTPDAPTLVSPFGPAVQMMNQSRLGLPDRTAEFQEWLALQSSVAVELDSVVFADGSSIGADQFKLLPRLSATLTAERDLFQAIVASSANSAEMASWLKSLSDRRGIAAAAKASGNVEGNSRYKLAKAESALDCLQLLEAKGLASLRTFASTTLSQKPYPVKLMNN